MRRTLLTVMLALVTGPAWAGIPAEQDECLGCHGSDPSMSMDLPSGEKLGVYVDQSVFAKSVHGEILRCSDCHSDKQKPAGESSYPHDTKPFANRRDLTVRYYEGCKACHFANYTKTLDGVHYAQMAKGNRQAALCVDCHGSHDIRKPSEPRTRISEACAKCHEGVATAYAKSVHGQALTTAAARDVPVCTDCHSAHAIAGPHQQDWELRTPDLCGKCHADEMLMKKYGLSTAVLKTYLADFHGKTASLRQHQGATPTGPVVARCTDCHGVHDIQRAKSADSPVLKANLSKTCGKCHADANENFPDAWLSHYEPSWQKAPLVYGVKMTYAVVIPFMIGGLGLQILLHLWRLMANR